MAPFAGFLRMSEKSRRMNSKGKEQFRFVPMSSSSVKAVYPRYNPAATNILVTSGAASDKKKTRHRADSHMPDLYVLVEIVEAECKDDTWIAQIVDIIGESTDLASCAAVLMHNRGLTEGNQPLQPRPSNGAAATTGASQGKGSKTVFTQAEGKGAKVAAAKPSPVVCEPGRIDLRSAEGEKNATYTIFSVDPPGCLDIDDAVHIRQYSPAEVAELQPLVVQQLGLQSVSSQADIEAALSGVVLYEVGVHIADVTNQIKHLPAGSESKPHPSKPRRTIAEEALHRSFTVYLPDQQIPILPTFLSHDECSLKPGEDRLAMSCLVTVAVSAPTVPGTGFPVKDGGRPYKVLSSRFQRSLIRTAGAYSYDQVDQFLDNQQASAAAAERAAQAAGGAIDGTDSSDNIEHQVREQNPELRLRSAHAATDKAAPGGTATAPELKIGGNLSGKAPTSAVKFSLKLLRKLFPTLNSHEIVEQLMLLANTCAAEFLETESIAAQRKASEIGAGIAQPKSTNAYLVRRQLPAKFVPLPSMQELSIADGDIPPEVPEPSPADGPRRPNFTGVPVDFTAFPAEYLYCPADLIGDTAGGALSAVEKAHVSLGARLYTHFTSPIRRYADQIVHALINQYLPSPSSGLTASVPAGVPASVAAAAADPWLESFSPAAVTHINLKQKQHKKFSRDMTIVEFVFDQCATSGRNEVTLTAEAVVLPFRFSDKYSSYKTDLYVFAPCEFVYPVRLHTAAQAQLFDVTYTENAVLLQSRQTKEIKRLRVGERITVQVHCSVSAPTIRKKCVISSPSITFL